MKEKDIICNLIHELPSKERKLVEQLVKHLATRGQASSPEQEPSNPAPVEAESKEDSEEDLSCPCMPLEMKPLEVDHAREG